MKSSYKKTIYCSKYPLEGGLEETHEILIK